MAVPLRYLNILSGTSSNRNKLLVNFSAFHPELKKPSTQNRLRPAPPPDPPLPQVGGRQPGHSGDEQVTLQREEQTGRGGEGRAPDSPYEGRADYSNNL